MTIRTLINPAALNRRLEHLERCAEEAPEGAYDLAKQLRSVLGETCDTFMQRLRELGLQVNNCDGIREIEAILYGYVLEANDNHSALVSAETFGEHIDGPAGERVRANCLRDMETLRSLEMLS